MERNALIQAEAAENLLRSEYTMEDLFEMGQSSYEMNLQEYMFVKEQKEKDCLLFFICQAGGISASMVTEYDFNAAEPSMTVVMPGYDFALTITCSSADPVQRKAIIYTTVSDLPDDIKEVLHIEVMQG